MNSLLMSIGYSTWVLPALLLIPLVGAAAIWVHGATATVAPGDEVGSGAANAPRMLALARPSPSSSSSRSGSGGASTPRTSIGSPSSIWLGFRPWGIRFMLGVDGIAVMMILLTTFIMLLAVGGSWTQHPRADAQLLRAAARAHHRHARRVHGARPLPVLRDVGSDARADVLHHRHLGRRPAHLREPQVLHLHDDRIAADARGDRVPRVRQSESSDGRSDRSLRHGARRMPSCRRPRRSGCSAPSSSRSP